MVNKFHHLHFGHVHVLKKGSYLAMQLSEQFDSLFATTTGYEALDRRIAMTRAKKEGLTYILKSLDLSGLLISVSFSVVAILSCMADCLYTRVFALFAF